MPDACDRLGVLLEVDDAGARHLERAHLPLDRTDHCRGIHLDRSGREVAVEEVVPVLVARDALHDLVAGRVLAALPGVVVRDARRQLLQRDVDHAVLQELGLRHLAPLHLGHAGASSAIGSIERVTVR